MPDIHEGDHKAKDRDMKKDKTEKDIQETNGDTQAAPQDKEDDALQSQLKAAEAKRDEYLGIAQRVQAEFENYKRRNRTALQDACQVAADETILAFLPVLDNLQRALAAARDSEDIEDIITGVEMVIKQFVDLLAQMDVKPIEAVGQPFDPEYHHAVMKVEAKEPEEADTVTEELMKGYMRKDKVIRYSMVKVAN